MQVLVIGGTRFLGKYVVQSLVQAGHRVASVNLDDQAAQRLPAGVESIYCNRKDHARLRAALADREVDAVIDIVYAPTVPDDIAVVLDAVGARLQRYVFCSSSTVYKKTGVYPITEDDPRQGDQRSGGYTQNKVDCEDFLFDQHARHGTPITIIRPRHIYGPENYTYREAFHFDRLTRGRPILIPGDGWLLTQWVHVEDLADAFRLAVEREVAVGQAYTVTGREAITLDAYVDLLGRVTETTPRKVYFDLKLLERFPEPGMYFGESERLEDGHGCFDVHKAREQLGWVQRFSLEDGMRHTYAWYRATDGGDTFRMRVLDFTFEDELIRLAGGAQ
jgi:nucleoside-diphosphate-sugar epimerase